MEARLLPMGGEALLVEVADSDAALGLRAHLAPLVERGAGVWEFVDHLVVGARTVLVVLRDSRRRPDVGRACLAVAAEVAATITEAQEQVVEVVVRYDGPDLADIAELTGLTRAEVVRAHTSTPWRVAFGGFAPGFAYLVGGDSRLHVPRRDEPRARVPAGSVALAGGFSGIYPQASPGGWQLIGTTEARLWDVDRDPPALLRPGGEVRFVAGDTAASPTPSGAVTDSSSAQVEGAGAAVSSAHGRALEVLATGPLTLVEDLGRGGLADVGVGRSGAADRTAYLLGLRLVGHAGHGDDAPASLECTLGGLTVRARGDLLVALTGADCLATVDGVAAPLAAPFAVADGQVLSLLTPQRGLRTWLAVRGGVDVTPVLGSRSTDLLSGLGPPPLAPGDVLPVGAPPPTFPATESAPLARTTTDDVVTLTMTAGPRADWCDPADLAGTQDVRIVSQRSDRSGIRLEGRPIRWAPGRRGEELPSEGMVAGAVQVPPGGEPVVFLADHPVTGGYPVIGVLTPPSQARSAQLRPGDRVRLRLR